MMYESVGPLPGFGHNVTSYAFAMRSGVANGATGIDNCVMPEKNASEQQSTRRSFNRTMAQGEWERRVARAEQLLTQQISAPEILRFYLAVANFQKEFSAELDQPRYQSDAESAANPFAASLPESLVARFHDFLLLVARRGPAALQQVAHELEASSRASQLELLQSFWGGNGGGAGFS